MKTSKRLSQEPNKTPAKAVADSPTIRSREENIAVIAYFKAQARGFGENAELDDWLAAEREFDEARSNASQLQG